MDFNTKLFRDMTPQEQLRYIADLRIFTEQKLPLLEQLGDAWEASNYKDMETGLLLISAFGYARDFVRRSKMFGDYNRRVSRLRYYVQKISDEINNGKAMRTKAAIVAQVSPLSAKGSRRRGRPTLEEKKVMIEEEKIIREQERKNSLFPDEKEDLNLRPLTTNGIIANPDAESLSSTMPHLDQLKWLMSEALKNEVSTVRDIRGVAASNAERAKILAEQGANPDIIAPYATAAADSQAILSNIYAKVDREMAELYYRLKVDKNTIEKYEATNVKVEDLRHLLKPFFTKVTTADATFVAGIEVRMAEEDPAQAQQREKEQKKKDEVAQLVKYITRNDKKPSPTRIAGIESRLKRLKALVGEERANEYVVYLDKTKTDYENLLKQQEEGEEDGSK